MAITDAEKQEIIDGLLEEIRANGLDYSGQTITFPDAFNITQTERQNVKIPAIDERSSTPVHGNVDLEALLNAYGLTKVEEIASDIASSYMKKVADSDFNMNGYKISNISQLISKVANASNTSKIIPVGEYFWHKMGLSSGGFDDTMKAMLKNICIDYADAPNYSIFIGSVRYSSRTFFIAQIDSTSTVDATTGLPSYCKGIVFDYNKNNIHRFGTSNYVYSRTLFLGFDDSDSSKNYAINAFGSNYIRYENGLQICWNTVNVSGVSVPTALTSTRITVSTNFPQRFIEIPKCIPVSSGADSIIYIGAIKANVAGIEYIRVMKDTTVSNYSLSFDYVAVGKWK